MAKIREYVEEPTKITTEFDADTYNFIVDFCNKTKRGLSDSLRYFVDEIKKQDPVIADK